MSYGMTDFRRKEHETGPSRRSWLPMATASVWLLLGLVAEPALARNDGIDSSEMTPAQTVSSCGGTLCHLIPGTPDPDLTVTISGPSTLSADETDTYTIAVTGTFGPNIIGAGVHVSAFMDDILTDINEGILTAVTIDTQITTSPAFGASGQLTHTDATANGVGIYSYDFDVTAPPFAAELRLEGAMNAFDGNGNQLGEEWNVDTKIITVPEPTAWLAQLFGGLLVFRLSARGARTTRGG